MKNGSNEGLENKFVIRLTWRVQLVEQERLTLPKDLSSPPIFSRVRVTRSLVLCVCFVDRCLSFFFWWICCMSFDLWILITPLISWNSSQVAADSIFLMNFSLTKHGVYCPLKGWQCLYCEALMLFVTWMHSFPLICLWFIDQNVCNS